MMAAQAKPADPVNCMSEFPVTQYTGRIHRPQNRACLQMMARLRRPHGKVKTMCRSSFTIG
jgi:hypothetical protein